MSDRDKDAEILALRRQITVLERQLGGDRVRFAPGDRAFLAALLHRLPLPVLRRVRLLGRPDTVLRWHRDLRTQATRTPTHDPIQIDTVLLRRWFVLFFIDHGARRVHIAGITRQPTGPWITEQARNHLMDLGDRAESIKFLIRDRGAYFTDSFDAVFQAAGARVIPTLPAVPRVNAIAERPGRLTESEPLSPLAKPASPDAIDSAASSTNIRRSHRGDIDSATHRQRLRPAFCRRAALPG
ncbi:hypothetical protein [Streptomyces sp. NPDC021212]|uniref:hypothetical protein n=1 Tax=Streptomyces sp. NPDC021212 TaxID=3365118 RepID=UPI00378DA459